MIRRLGLALALALGALSAGCGDDGGSTSDTTTTSAASGAASGTVVLKGNKFLPERITVSAGDTVTWQWDDGSVAHDVNGGEAFSSEIKPTGTFEHTFEEPGTFDYKCTVHPSMTGSVEVTE